LDLDIFFPIWFCCSAAEPNLAALRHYRPSQSMQDAIGVKTQIVLWVV